MGRQESPPPRQRPRVPHHSRHRRHHDRCSPTRTTNRKSALSLGRLNRHSHAPDSHIIVESWLGQVTAPVSASPPVSPKARNQPIHLRKRSRPQDRPASPCSQGSKRVGPLWRPRHIPPAQGSSPPRLLPPTNRERNPKRHKRDYSDSSLISDPSPHREPREWSYHRAASEHEESPSYKPLSEAEVDIVSASPPTSHLSTVSAFEKRPRHKTKADKYDTKRLGDCARRKKDEHRPRRSKSKKRRHLLAGKNVMNNFTSEAVLNDRITVHPNLKPGLFGNKRLPKRGLVTDLSFSEMPFPIHQERDVPQQKGLSSSRLRERRRESRELEQISSFFLPVGADAPQCKAKPARLKCNEEDKSNRLNYSDNASRDSFGTPSSPSAPAQSHRQPVFVSQESHFSAPAAALSNTDCRPTSSTATTYFTWPSSQYSPKASKCLVGTQPDSTEPAQPATPENIQEALAATGVYKDTGIHHYDSLNDQKTRIFEIRQESPSTHSSVVDYVDSEEGQTPATNQKSKLKPKHSDSTRAIMARLAHVEKRWNTILPPEWRLNRSSAVNVPLTIEEPASVVLGLPTSTKPSNCQEIALEALAKPSQGSHPAQLSSRYGKEDYESNPNSTSKGLVPAIPEPDPVVDHASTADNDRASIASRDAMPPPPIPLPRIDSLHPTNPKPRDDTSSPICIGTTMPLETQAQIPKYEHRQWTDTYETTSKLRELSNEPGKVIPTLDSASWIPQVKTPSITYYNRDKNSSEQSMKPPLYRSQGREEIPQVAAHLNPSYTTDITESIADFIARIESEFEESTSLDKFRQPESIIENPELSFNPIVSTRNTQDQKSIAPEGFQIEHRQLPIDGPEFGFGEVLELDPSFHEYQKPVVSINHRPTTMPAEDLVDDSKEFLEMSSFWRPNRFSNF